MKTTLLASPGIARIGTRIIAALGLGIACALASPTVELKLGGEEFGVGIDVDAQTIGNKQLSPSTSYSFRVKGTCTGTGALAGLAPPGTEISTFLDRLKKNSGKKLSGVYPNPGGKLPILVIDETITGTKTIPLKSGGTVDVTISAKIAGGTNADGTVYLKVTEVSAMSSSPVPLGTIKFDKGALFIINTAPEIQFFAQAQRVNESAQTVHVKVTRYANTTEKTSVHYFTSDGTASSDQDKDFTAVTDGVVKFGNTGTSATTAYIDIDITDNMIKDKARNFTITLVNPASGSVLAPKRMTKITIDNDD